MPAVPWLGDALGRAVGSAPVIGGHRARPAPQRPGRGQPGRGRPGRPALTRLLVG
ncbi:hypothetical protein [Nocardioides sp. TF02-7]|uniref:hypothetical protein n=1 Tax=Nocardioides sp. TF02-7 TaxID=2917724 RepID=UPI001F06282C|nr:hypothetical protein [Nocardioides sp. TF02-7]UMG93041.1 hypothetical protein MF408_01470 [Nocardioides sp. TF02-7]